MGKLKEGKKLVCHECGLELKVVKECCCGDEECEIICCGSPLQAADECTDSCCGS
jgi:hypothetical protein